MDRAIDATATQKGRVCGIDDGVDWQGRDIRLDDFDSSHR